MKKVITSLIVILFFVTGATTSFVWAESLCVPQMGYNLFFKTMRFSDLGIFKSSLPGEMFIESINAVFTDRERSKVTDIMGNDITDTFVSRYGECFSEGKYLPIWKYAKDNVYAILFWESIPSKKEFQVHGSKYTAVNGEHAKVQIKGSKYFIKKDIKYGAERKIFELMSNIEGNYVVDLHTGKIVSADITSVWVDDNDNATMWDFRIAGCYFNVVPYEDNALFISSIDYAVYAIPDMRHCSSGNLSSEFVVFSK